MVSMDGILQPGMPAVLVDPRGVEPLSRIDFIGSFLHGYTIEVIRWTIVPQPSKTAIAHV